MSETNTPKNKNIDVVIQYFLSGEAKQYFQALRPLTNGSCVISHLPNEATGHVGNVQLISNRFVFQAIQDLDDDEAFLKELESVSCQE